jgi:hypothetical protein
VEVDADVGINVNLNMGKIDKSPDFQKDLFNTQWPLFTTCMGFGPDVQTPTPVPEPTSIDQPEPIPTEIPIATEIPTANETPIVTETPVTTDIPVTTNTMELTTPSTELPTMVITTGPPLATGTEAVGTGVIGTGTISGGYPVAANRTFIRMAKRKPTIVSGWY